MAKRTDGLAALCGIDRAGDDADHGNQRQAGEPLPVLRHVFTILSMVAFVEISNSKEAGVCPRAVADICDQCVISSVIWE